MGNKCCKGKARKNIASHGEDAQVCSSSYVRNVNPRPEKSITVEVPKLYPVLDEMELRMIKLKEKTPPPSLQNNPRYSEQHQITKHLRRRSTQSLKPLGIVYRLGESNSGLKAHFDDPLQDYEKLKQQHLRAGTLFEDPIFPANDSSFYLSGKKGEHQFEWLRPGQIVKSPQFISDGAERFDVCQGDLGNCWFLAAVANLTLHKGHLERVVPHDQSFAKGQYAGIFHFRFWQYGKWIDVVVDDRLPTQGGQLKLMHSQKGNEFWSALLEKAYAKLHGSYESLVGGYTIEAMEDLTGGLSEQYKLQSEDCPGDLFKIMLKAQERGSFMGCNIHGSDEEVEEVTILGLVKRHAYSITSVKVAQTSHGKDIRFIRIRNPWGSGTEWKGDWRDGSKLWAYFSESEKRALGYRNCADGEFFMTFSVFKKCFTGIQITSLTPDLLEEDTNRQWKVKYFDGQWIPGVSSGGSWRKNRNTFYLNPQYMITLADHDEGDDTNLCTCVVAVMQKHRQIKRKLGQKELKIGFSIYAVEKMSSRKSESGSQVKLEVLNSDFFLSNEPVAQSDELYQREVIGRFRLKPGRYCIVPYTSKANQKRDFMIRFFTEKAAKSVLENDDDISWVTQKGVNKKKEAKTASQVLTNPTERSDAFKFFQDVAGADLEVDAFELQKILNKVYEKELKREEFSVDACRSMVAMMDFDGSGKLGFDEFYQLWGNIKSWCAVFKKYDHDDSKSISAGELKEAFCDSVGIKVNRQILRLLVNRFGHHSKSTSTIEDQLYFDDFICCSLKMKRCIEVWKDKKTKQVDIPSAFFKGNLLDQSSLPSKSSFSLDEFMRNVLYT